MKLYHYLDLPHLDIIKEKVIELVPDWYYKDTVFQGHAKEVFDFPELREAVEYVKPWDEVTHIAVITTMPYAQIHQRDTYIHVDVMANNWHGQEQSVCLNFPIYNCDQTYVGYYESSMPPNYVDGHYENGVAFKAYHYPREFCTEIDRMYLPKPALFYTQLPHGIVNETDESRIVLSVRFSTAIDLNQF